MDLTQIRYFLALAKSLNFTRAAEACHVTQPALTKSIQRLEDELGGPLLLRERSNTQLTELGRAMQPMLQQTFDAATAARRHAQTFRQQDVARLRIGLGNWISPDSIMPLIRPLAEKFATLELAVRQGSTAALNQWLLDQEIDVILTMDPAALTDRANSWAVFEDRVAALFPAGHRLATSDPLPAELLRGEILVGPLDWLDSPALTVRHRGATEEQVRSLVRAGLGVALTTERQSRQPGLICRPLDPPRLLEVHVAAIAGRPASRQADAFLRLARARLWVDHPL